MDITKPLGKKKKKWKVRQKKTDVFFEHIFTCEDDGIPTIHQPREKVRDASEEYKDEFVDKYNVKYHAIKRYMQRVMKVNPMNASQSQLEHVARTLNEELMLGTGLSFEQLSDGYIYAIRSGILTTVLYENESQ